MPNDHCCKTVWVNSILEVSSDTLLSIWLVLRMQGHELSEVHGVAAGAAGGLVGGLQGVFSGEDSADVFIVG